MLDKTDVVVLVQDAQMGETDDDRALPRLVQRGASRMSIAMNKADLLKPP